MFVSFGEPVDAEVMRRQRISQVTLPDYRPINGRFNRWGYDPEEQRTQTYTGMGTDINVHDQWAVESQGSIYDRAEEHLSPSDVGIRTHRRMFLPRPRSFAANLPGADRSGLRTGCDRCGHAPARTSTPHGKDLDAATALRIELGVGAGPPVKADTVLDRIRDDGLHSVRVVFADQHGCCEARRSRQRDAAAFEDGIGVPGSLLHKDTGNTYAVGLWEPTGDETLDTLVGARNIVMRPDPSTFRSLPWSTGTGLVLSDLETTDGEPIPHSTRSICRDALARLQATNWPTSPASNSSSTSIAVGDDGAWNTAIPAGTCSVKTLSTGSSLRWNRSDEG